MGLLAANSMNITDYWNNLDWFALVDLFIFLAISILVFVFFKKRHSLKMTIFLAVYSLVYIGLFVGSGFIGHSAFYVALKLMEFSTIFLIVFFVVVYQSDFKVIAAKIARSSSKNDEYIASDEALVTAAHEMVTACQNMAKNDIGALIIIVKTSVPDRILDTGTELNAIISAGLLESIFSTKGPLHDGAVVVKGNRILSAGCFLPLSKEVDIAKELGTRHRAAIGITEESDVVAIVVSEETGVISTTQAGKITRYMTPERLLEEIKAAFNITMKTKTKKTKRKDKKFV